MFPNKYSMPKEGDIMKYNFVVKSNQYQKIIVDNMEIEFYRHIYNGTVDDNPILWDKMAVGIKIMDEDGAILGHETTDTVHVDEMSFRFGADILVDVIGYDSEPCEIPVVEREYFGVHIYLDGSDGKMNVTLETGLGKYLDTGNGAISHVDADKNPPSVQPYRV